MTAQPLSEAEQKNLAYLDADIWESIKRAWKIGRPLTREEAAIVANFVEPRLATISRDRQKARVGEDVRDGVVAAMRKALDEPKGPTDEMVADAALRHLHSIGYVMRPGRDAVVDLLNRLVDGNGHSWPSTYIIADALLSAMEQEKGA